MPDTVTRRQFFHALLHSPSAGIQLTPTDQFFQQSWRRQPIPRDAEYWGLLLDGLVSTPLPLSLHDLQHLPQASLTCTVACTGDLIGTARWQGVTFAALLAEVQPQAQARYAGFYTADGYVTSLALPQLDGAILATRMNDTPLPHANGGPLRLIVPGRQGYKMPKWLQRIELRDIPLAGPWEQRGWSQDGDVPTLARFTYPQHRGRASARTLLAGFAFAGDRKIGAVEISINDSPWMPVTFQTPGPYLWSRWSIDWTAPYPGEHRLTVRAADTHQSFSQPHTITVYVE